jgi:hypothetical protein
MISSMSKTMSAPQLPNTQAIPVGPRSAKMYMDKKSSRNNHAASHMTITRATDKSNPAMKQIQQFVHRSKLIFYPQETKKNKTMKIPKTNASGKDQEL